MANQTTAHVSETKNAEETCKQSAPESRSTIQLKSSLRGQPLDVQFKMLAPPTDDGNNVPVQLRGGTTGDAATVHAAAAQGIQGSGGVMPYLSQIQQSFGRHDISGVQAHTGSQTQHAAAAMGAEAYATGNHVAFGKSPDLHTAAHEAAHVVQQRGGVALAGGVGASGDSYEQHADRVADTVIKGESAEALLDTMSGGMDVQQKTVQRKDEPKAKWTDARTLAKDSFFDLVLANKAAAEAWKTRASVEDPPPFWQTALKAVGGLVLNAALGGVGATIASKLVTAGTKVASQIAIRTAINIGTDAAKAGANAAIGAGSGEGKKAALIAYCHQQAMAMLQSAKAARESFFTSAGNEDEQKLTIAEMNEVKAANDTAFNNAQAIQDKEMLVGWMGMQAGNTAATPGTKSASTEGNVEDIDNDGILRLTISGLNDSPFTILKAEVDGLNAGLRRELSGTKLGDWLVGGKRTQGIDVLVTTGDPGSRATNFQLTPATYAKAEKAGVAPSKRLVVGTQRAVFFSFLAERTGASNWVDSDMDLHLDYNWGADAGRWFLDNVKGTRTILDELRSKTLPHVVG